MLGAAQSFSALGRFSGPVLFGELYDRIGPRTAFLAAGAAMVMAWAVTLRVPRERAPAPPAAPP
jgi:MFS family permease